MEMRNESPPLWIKDGMELNAMSSSRNLLCKAKVTHGPYKDLDEKWKVILQFFEEDYNDERQIVMEEEVVECSYCSPISNNKAAPCHLSHDEARKRAIEHLHIMDSHKNYYAPELLEKAVDTVGFPYGSQDVMRKVHEMTAHAELLEAASAWDVGPGTFKVTKGMKIRRFWYDGLAYDGHVASTTTSEQFIDGKWQAVYTIEYENTDSDLFTEQEVRMRRYPKPEMSSVLGHKFAFLELFCGACKKQSI